MHLFIRVLALQLASYLEVGNDGHWDINAKRHPFGSNAPCETKAFLNNQNIFYSCVCSSRPRSQFSGHSRAVTAASSDMCALPHLPPMARRAQNLVEAIGARRGIGPRECDETRK